MNWRLPRPLPGRPRVSVVVPCYRYGHYLSQCVGSILAQPGVDVDVLIVDDASPDDSAEVARELAAQDPRIRVLVHESNAGHIQTYNDGLLAVDGQYVVLLSADDMLAPGALARATALMEHNPRVAFTYGYPKNFTTTPEIGTDRQLGWSVWGGEQWIERTCRRGRSFIMSPEVVMRGKVMRELVGYDPGLPHSADMDLWLRAAMRGDVGHVHGPPQAYYRVHDSNMHLTTYSGTLHDLEARRETFGVLLSADARDPTGRARLHSLAMRSLAQEALRLAREANYDPRLDPGSAAEFENFARDTSPQVTAGTRWALHRGALAGLERAPVRAAARAGNRLNKGIAWHRWRYGGTV